MSADQFEDAYQKVHTLVNVFQQNQKHYLSPAYSEADARKDFIDKFWIALGWDVNHEAQTNPYQQEVKVERTSGGSERRRRADYAFLAENFRDVRFYVEAKKPSVELENKDYYFQTIRYAWNSHTPLAVLTDFEQLHVLDCRYKPDIDTALSRGIEKHYFADYAERDKFAEVYHLFSREAVINGSLERYVESLPRPSGKARQQSLFAVGVYQSVDESFLQNLDEYREELVRSFKNKNQQLGSDELTEVIQRTLDRLVFIRFLEDKLIEPEPIVENFGKKSSAWQDFVSTSVRLDRVYNGTIFKKHQILDSPNFRADEGVFDDICENLSHIHSPYDFNAIPIHILGSIYERFLGKTVVATEKRARVEEKPEVRKAGGVYYTPEYIVRYIVENTVGKLVEGRTPDEIKGMRFADIACGSGSFLLGVYDLLLRYHTAYYNANKTRRKQGSKAGGREHADGTLHLSLVQRRNILLNNIFGVDIDAQAIEVAQMSLYLKMLEDETTSTAKKAQLELSEYEARQALLPSLSKNIICGNSLVGWDVVDGLLFETAEQRKLNPMDFEISFPQTMKAGGFDAVVGNPPYVGFHGFKMDKEYLKRKYLSASGKFDYYLPFIEQALRILRPAGLMSFICPTNFTKRAHGEGLRRHLKRSVTILQVCDFQDTQIFSGALNYTGIFVLQKSLPDIEHRIAYQERTLDQPPQLFRQAALPDNAWIFRDESASKVLESIEKQPTSSLGAIAKGISEGIVTGLNSVFLIPTNEARSLGLEEELIRCCLRGRQIRRYRLEENTEIVIYPYRSRNGKTEVLTESELKMYPATWEYLRTRRSDLKGRSYFDSSSKQWFELWCQRDLNLLETRKIVVSELAESNRFALADESQFYGDTVCGITLGERTQESLEYVLGLLNSRLIQFYYKRTTVPKANGFYIYKTMFLKNIPIRRIEFSDKSEKARHDKLVQLVKEIVVAEKQLHEARTDRDKAFCENKCTTIDRKIDRLVYDLYSLTDEDIAIVEGEASPLAGDQPKYTIFPLLG